MSEFDKKACTCRPKVVLDDVHWPPGVQHPEAELISHRAVLAEELVLIGRKLS